MKNKILLACILLLCTNLSYGQDSTAAINTTWAGYVADTSLTYKQAITICDSHIVIEYPLPQNSLYINLGDWLRYDSYAVFDGEQLKLQYYTPPIGK